MIASRIEFPKFAFTKKLLIIWAAAFLTFGTFIVTSLCWGGAALNGKVQEGRFYLGDHGEFREVGRGYYAVSAVLSMIWPAALALGASQLLAVFPATPNTKKLFLVLTIFFSLIAATFSITSLICLLRVFA
jgi:hypothetical protein